MDTMFVAGAMIGSAGTIGLLVPLGLLWLGHQRRKDQAADLMATNLLRGWNQTEEPSTGRHAVREALPLRAAWLDDAQGAFAQAHTAFIPVYPGNTGKYDEPDEAWLAWLGEEQLDYWGPRTQTGKLREMPWRRREQEWVPWGPLDRVLGRLTLMTLSTSGVIYPWWQKVADRIWEWSMFAEHRAMAINRVVTDAFDAFVDSTADLLARTIRGVVGAVADGLQTLAYIPGEVWYGTPTMRPKRQYRAEDLPRPKLGPAQMYPHANASGMVVPIGDAWDDGDRAWRRLARQ